MHYWGYLIERLLNDDPRRSTRRSRGSRRATRVSAREDRVWSETAPWL
jgi:hypothetical protein